MTREPETKSEYDYRGWKIRITDTKVDTKFSSRIEVWKPGHDPRSHSGTFVSFQKRAATQAEAQMAARLAAEEWIKRETEDSR